MWKPENNLASDFIELWYNPELNILNIDDQFLSKGAICLFLSANATAIFDLAEIKDLVYFTISMRFSEKPSGHVYVPVFRNNECGLINNIIWMNKQNGLYEFQNGNVFLNITTKESWVCLKEDSYPTNKINSSLSEKGVLDLLKYMQKRYPKTRIFQSINPTTRTANYITIDKYLQNYQSSNFVKYDF